MKYVFVVIVEFDAYPATIGGVFASSKDAEACKTLRLTGDGIRVRISHEPVIDHEGDSNE